MKILIHRTLLFLHDDDAQDLIEYALVAAIIALGAISAMQSVATTLSSAFTQIGTTITSAL